MTSAIGISVEPPGLVTSPASVSVYKALHRRLTAWGVEAQDRLEAVVLEAFRRQQMSGKATVTGDDG